MRTLTARHIFSTMLVLCVVLVPLSASATIDGFLSTPIGSGMYGGGKWAPPADGMGYRIDWSIGPNGDGTWHYIYDFTNQSQGELTPAVSHVTFQLSENIKQTDLFNYVGDIESIEFGTYGEHPSNPGFPVGKSIFGVKFNLEKPATHVEFDSNRKPMWGDFYSKGGKDSYVYNIDLGVAVANPDDYMGTPVDVNGHPLLKILTPDTIVMPEPGLLSVLGLGGLVLLGLVRKRAR